MMDHLSNSLPQRLVTAFGKCKARIHLRNISSEITSNKQTNKRPQERREECHRGRLGRSGAVCRRLPPRPGSRTWRGNIWRCEFTPTCCLELCCVAWAILSCVCDSQWYCCSDPEWLCHCSIFVNFSFARKSDCVTVAYLSIFHLLGNPRPLWTSSPTKVKRLCEETHSLEPSF